MIAGIVGKVSKVRGDGIDVETSAGLIFFVRMPASQIPAEGEEVRLYVHTVFNQQSGFELYGFKDEAQLEVFRTLLEVPGIGPAMALRILSELSLKELAMAVRMGNVNVLKRVKGLGTKKAEMVVFALKDVPLPEVEEEAEVSEAIKALTVLGMDYVQARDLVLQGVREGLKSVEDLISYALKRRGG